MKFAVLSVLTALVIVTVAAAPAEAAACKAVGVPKGCVPPQQQGQELRQQGPPLPGLVAASAVLAARERRAAARGPTKPVSAANWKRRWYHE